MIAPIHVKAYHCTPDGLLLPHVMAQLCQDIASDQADSMGFGFEHLREHGWIWALALFQLEIVRPPRYGMTLSLETWPSSVGRLRASREFRMTDDRGDVFLLGSSDWMALDAQSRKPQNLDRLEMEPHLRPERLLGDKLSRHKTAGDGRELASFRIPVSALDANGHVNNTEYLRFSYDALYADGHRTPLRAFSMAFLNEAFLDDVLILRHTLENGQHCVAGCREATPIFSALFTPA